MSKSLEKNDSVKRNFESIVFSNKTVFFAFLFVFIFRIFYVTLIIDPHSGQDAPSFSEDAGIVISDGVFTELVHAPWWPVGYTWWVSLWWSLFGVNSRALGVAQTTLLLIAQIFFFLFAKKVVSDYTAKLFSYLLLINFALLSSSGQIMYETPMLSFLVLGAFNLRHLILDSKFALSSAIYGGICFFLAVLMHPSALAISLILVFVATWRNLIGIKMWANTLIVITFLLSGVGVQIYRNSVAGDGVGFTTTTFSSALLGGWGANDPEKAFECESIGKNLTGTRSHARWDNPERQICLYLLTAKDPSQVFEVAWFNSRRYWSPYTGVLKGGGTWYHGFDFRRFINDWYTWWEGKYRVVDSTLGYLWMLTHLSLFIIGFRRFPKFLKIPLKQARRVKWFFAAPVLISYLVSLLTLGDTRHRMPVMFFYEFFVVIGIMATANYLINFRLSKREKSALSLRAD